MSMTDAHAAKLRAVGFTGRGLDCAVLLLEAQHLLEHVEFGRITFHIGSNKVVLNLDRQLAHRRWSDDAP